jgi:prevent-host-death family protein
MRTWQAAEAQHKFGDVVDAAVAGEPQVIERRDGQTVVLVSAAYFEATRTDIKTFLPNHGYAGEGEAEFDGLMQEVRCEFPDLLSRRAED